MRCLLSLTLVALLLPSPAMAQFDLTGSYNAIFHEDQPERIPGPSLGDYVGLRREGGHFRPEAGTTPTAAPATSNVRGGALESSNVQLPERMVQLTEVSRAFEALQRGITTLMNDVDGRAISELGRR